MTDSHLHTLYSHDGKDTPESIVEQAIKLGFDYIAFTDHIDRDYLFISYDFFNQIDLPKYTNHILELKEKYASQITIALGAELGFLAEANDMYKKDIASAQFDVILNSTHTVFGHDMFFPSFFEIAGSQEKAYEAYLKTIRLSLDAPYQYDIVSHIGYVQKNSPFEDNDIIYSDFNDILDDILLTIIKYDKCMEVNSKINICDTITMPNTAILKRYFELGGRKISFGSDAHYLNSVGHNYKTVAKLCSDIGFDGFTYFKKHIPYLDKF